MILNILCSKLDSFQFQKSLFFTKKWLGLPHETGEEPKRLFLDHCRLEFKFKIINNYQDADTIFLISPNTSKTRIDKISKIERFAEHILDLVVTFDVQKLEHSCCFDLKFLHYKIRAHASTDNVYSAIDKASTRLIRLVQKYKTQLQKKHAVDSSVIDLKVNVFRPQEDELAVINSEIESENAKQEQEKYEFHKIISREVLPLRMLTHKEAVMRMELSGDKFMVFKSEEDQKLKIIYPCELTRGWSFIYSRIK